MPNARLLLVLDEISAKELQVSLNSLGYQVVDSISNGQKALERVAELRPDLALVGIHLNEELGGILVGKQIYDQYDLPVIYISDQSGQATLRRSGGTAPFGYLFSPADEKQILATIEVALTRHSMEKKVRESEQWLSAILHSISDGVIALDMEERIRFINPIAEELTHKKRLDVIDKPLDDVLSLVYANSEERVTLSHVIAFFQSQTLRTGFEALLIRKDGTRVPVEIFISPLTDKDVQVGMVLVFQDITDRKRILEEIRLYAMRSAALLRAAEQLNARLDVKAVLSMVCEICNTTLNTTATSAFLHDPSQNALISIAIAVNNTVSTYKFDKQTFTKRYEIPVELILNVLSQSKPVVAIKDIQGLDLPGIPYLNKIKGMDVRSLAISGMYQNNALTGVLVAQMHGTVRDFTQEDLDLLRGLTDQATIAVGNATLFEQVVASRSRQQALTRRLVDVQEDERRNLARELHDQIGQMLTGLQFSLSALLPQAASEQKEKITSIQKMVSNLIAQTREISINLRPSMLDDTGLILTLIWHFDRYTSQTDIEVKFQHYNVLDKRFKPEIETAIYRIVQEALTNVARHANTDSVEVTIKLEGQLITVEISDQGQGFDLDQVDISSHMGLNSMRERTYVVGGLMDIQTAPGSGTCIHTEIPLSGKVERRQYERHRSTRG
jgi:PAS domain S-box-containing protein